MTYYNGWYAIKPKQTKLKTMLATDYVFMHTYVKYISVKRISTGVDMP